MDLTSWTGSGYVETEYKFVSLEYIIPSANNETT